MGGDSKMQCPSEDEQLRAFRACPKLSFETASAMLPNLVKAAKMLADTQAVCWEWGLFSIISLGSSLVPQDRFEPTPAISLPSSMWVCMVHPGATNSSGVIQVTSRAAEQMFARLNKIERARAEEDAVAAFDIDGKDHKPHYPPAREILAGGGSLAATGMQMSMGQNRSAAFSVEPEIEQVLMWFTAESSIDRGATAKLWDSVTWHRPVMEKRRAFTVPNPWYGFLCGGHIPELYRACFNDVFGIRQRVTASFGEPQFKSIKDLRLACDRLPVASKRPRDFLAGLMFPLLRWNIGLEQPMVYTVSEGSEAQQAVDKNFDAHMALQREAFLRPGMHDDAKHHGKMRCKFDRMTLAVHVSEAVCAKFFTLQQASPFGLSAESNWGLDFAVSEEIPKNVVDFSHFLGDHSEKIWKLLDFAGKNHSLPAEDVDASEPSQRVEFPVLPAVSKKLADIPELTTPNSAMGQESLDAFLPCQPEVVIVLLQDLPVKNITKDVLLTCMGTILRLPGRWFYYNKSDTVRKKFKTITADTCKESTIPVVFFACLVLDTLGLGRVLMTEKVSGGGRPNFMFVKSAVTEQMHVLLAFFGVDDDSTPSLQAYANSLDADGEKPPRAPTEFETDPPVDADVAAVRDLLGLYERVSALDVGDAAEAPGTPIGDASLLGPAVVGAGERGEDGHWFGDAHHDAHHDEEARGTPHSPWSPVAGDAEERVEEDDSDDGAFQDSMVRDDAPGLGMSQFDSDMNPPGLNSDAFEGGGDVGAANAGFGA